jgi:hypothetical protein
MEKKKKIVNFPYEPNVKEKKINQDPRHMFFRRDLRHANFKTNISILSDN